MNKQKKLKFIQTLTLKAITNIKSKNILVKLRFYEILYKMVLEGTIRNKREIYYLDVNIFKSQKVVDGLIKRTCTEMNETPFNLNITNTLKGVYYGDIVFYKGGEKFISSQTVSLIPDMNRIDRITTSNTCCIVFEKDTIFSKAVRELKDTKNYLLVCGKGYPCRNTLLFLSKLKTTIYGLFDYDPYGLDIFLKYSFVCPITRIGLNLDDVLLLSPDSLINFNDNDHKRMKIIKNNKLTSKEAFKMEFNGVKVELEGVFNLMSVLDYLKLKLNLSLDGGEGQQ